MGLDCTHDAWHGAYSHFNCFRTVLAKAAGITLDEMEGHTSNGHPWDPTDPLTVLLHHSDCDGEIEVKDLIPLADRLEELKPRYIQLSHECCAYAAEHINDWINACRTAAAAGEEIEFH